MYKGNTMQTIGIKDLQKNPAILTRSLAADEYTMITKRSTPIGLAISFDDTIIDSGLKTALMVDAYKKGYLSLGQFSKSIALEKEEALKVLSMMGVDVVDYDFEDDMKFLDAFDGHQ
jgi:predicted HTH domain antitoxin